MLFDFAGYFVSKLDVDVKWSLIRGEVLLRETIILDRLFEVIIFKAQAHLLTSIVIDRIELIKDFLETIFDEFVPRTSLMLS